MSGDDAVMRGFFQTKSLLIEAGERFGSRGPRVVAMASVMRIKAREEDPDAGVTTEDCYRFLCELEDEDPAALTAYLAAYLKETNE